MNYTECYQITIEERGRFMQNYNHWMNMYAIFNGALLVAYTSDFSKCNMFFQMLIILLGVFSSFLWVLSARGFYDWINSWIKVVSFYEAKLKNSEEDIDNNSVYIYRLFAGTGKGFPFSTQKCTKLFTIGVLAAWVMLFVKKVGKTCGKNECIDCCLIIISLLLVVIGVTVALCRAKEHLSNTHKKLTKKEDGNNNTLDSAMEEICGF
ncbi:MAG: hypothetical protein KBT02_05040 [Treponema sp.]|nr:hypothetical protein [Candidatus Treponema caballi]